LSSAAFDYEAPAVRDNVYYCGPELADPAWAAGVPAIAGDEPLIVVGLSTTYQGHEALLRRIIRAVAPLHARVVVTLGPALDPARFRAPRRVVVVQQASHAALLKDARLVVTHGGHGTVIRALAAGVPIVVLPLGRDQADNAARVVHVGAGLWLSARSSARRIRSAVARALGDEATLSAARRMRAAIAKERARDLAVELLEEA
jgi:MGT family glycosyltransferase